MVNEPNKHGTLLRDLQGVGFTDYEARVYVGLIQKSPATAYEVAKQHGLPRANVYTVLETLERKGAVQRVSSEPVRMVPIDPQTLFDRISRTMAERCASLQQRLESVTADEETHYVWNLASAADANARIGRLIAEARHHIWIKANHAMVANHLVSLHEAAERGVPMLLVLFGSEIEISALQQLTGAVVYAHEGDGTIVGLADALFTMTVDFEEALTFNFREQFGVFTRSGPIVNMADSLIRHEVYLAEIFAALGPELEENFGPALLSLRSRYLPADQFKALKDRLADSTATVRPVAVAANSIMPHD